MPKATQRPRIAACLIVRDEARCIARCLDSVTPWVDAMIVVDTGSTDDTVAIVQGCGAQVHHFTWTDHFAEARNFALDQSDADWNLIIDADEWIASGGRKLRRWCDRRQRLGTVCVESEFDAADATPQASRGWITRLLPRGVRYEGRVHEQPVSALPRSRVDLVIGHDGYRDAQMVGKRDRNTPLLLQELAARPDDPYLQFQLGAEAEGRHDYPQASDWYGKALAATRNGDSWRHDLTVRTLHCLGKAGRLDDALGLAGDLMGTWHRSPDFFFVLGNLLLDRAVTDPANAVGNWLPLACQAWERCLAIGERPDLDGSIAGRGSHLASNNLSVVHQQLALLAA